MTGARNTLRCSRWNSTRTAVSTRQCDHLEGPQEAHDVLQWIVVESHDFNRLVGELISSHWVVVLLIHQLSFLVPELPMRIHLSYKLSKQLVSKQKSHSRPKREVMVVRAPAQVLKGARLSSLSIFLSSSSHSSTCKPRSCYQINSRRRHIRNNIHRTRIPQFVASNMCGLPFGVLVENLKRRLG